MADLGEMALAAAQVAAKAGEAEPSAAQRGKLMVGIFKECLDIAVDRYKAARPT